MKKRLDQHLVDEGLAPSKTKAQEMIERGEVTVFNTQLKAEIQGLKASKMIAPAEIEIRVAAQNILKYVSRAGFKLEAALQKLDINVRGMKVLDVGQSTGGFTDCVLQQGASLVVGVDVAENELAEKLKNHPQVVALTGINARELRLHATKLQASSSRVSTLQAHTFDLVVVDVSFISVEKIWPEIYDFLKPRGHFLSLVKPQFEFDKKSLDKRGVVKDKNLFQQLEERLKKTATSLGLSDIKYFPSQLPGRDGNQEFFLYAKK